MQRTVCASLVRRGAPVAASSARTARGLDVPGVVAVAAHHALYFRRHIPADHLSVCLSVCVSVCLPVRLSVGPLCLSLTAHVRACLLGVPGVVAVATYHALYFRCHILADHLSVWVI